MKKLMLATTALATAAICAMAAPAEAANPLLVKGPTGLAKIGHIVVIYAENHSFDEEFGGFPHANGLKKLAPSAYIQRDRDGTVMPMLPPVFGGVIDSHEVTP
jgi:phospholipase C